MSQMKKDQSNVTCYYSQVTSFLISVSLLDGCDVMCFLKGAFSHFYCSDLNLPKSQGSKNLKTL